MTESPEETSWPGPAAPTGETAVDRTLELLNAVPGTPVSEHADVYTALHDSLLEALDAEPGLPPAAAGQAARQAAGQPAADTPEGNS
ncbi:hypothetical protein ACIPY3_13310 [Paenarthrobacter sp. NPDC089714]|uniref:hypothetical protein n=1 Tax=Paenarthrobacter sp. NPDC089714 TaxID=3364377 RepID=UPI0038308A7F